MNSLRVLEPSLHLLRALELCLTAADRLGVEPTRPASADLPSSVVERLRADLGEAIHDDILTLLAVADPVASRVTGLTVDAVGNWGRWCVATDYLGGTMSFEDYRLETQETGAEPRGYDCEWYTLSKSAGELSLYRCWDDEIPEFDSDLIVRIGPGDEEIDEPLVGEGLSLSGFIEERINDAIRFNKLSPLPTARAIPLDPVPRVVEG